MKKLNHLKIYEEFFFVHPEKFSKRSFGTFTKPEEPFKRELTKIEKRFIMNNFPNHSFSAIDNKGRIILGGGESPAGLYYITEDDLLKYMEETKNPNSKYNPNRISGGMG